MANAIRDLEIRTTRFDLNEVELTVVAEVDHFHKEAKLRGRLHGPRCLYSETIEIAYPLRTLAAKNECLRARVVIPEPSLWEPATPFLYVGTIELHEKGEITDRRHLACGIRHLALGTRGLRLNSHPLWLRGVRRESLDEADGLKLRQTGCNLVLSAGGDEELWDAADRIGFLVLGTIDRLDENRKAGLARLDRHASTFGWLFAANFPDAETPAFHEFLRREKRGLIGVELHEPPAGPLPNEIAFVACPASHKERFVDLGLPLLLLGRAGELDHAAADHGREALGWVAA